MDNFSGDTSPLRSRDFDIDLASPWEDHAPHASVPKLKFLCSYGGRIIPRPHDNRLSYVGGDTKIVALDRSSTFAAVSARLSLLSDSDVSFKYQLPGEDLDALISVTNDEDLLHMLHEYRRLCMSSPNPPRLRLFLFPASNHQGFIHAPNSVPTHPQPVSSPANNNVDFLFGLDKELPPPPPAADKTIDPQPEPVVSDPEWMQRLQPRDIRDKNENRSTTDDFYVQKKLTENASPVNLTATGPPPFWPEKSVRGGFYPATVGDQPVYMFTTPAGVYQAPPYTRTQASAGYYPVQPKMAGGNVMVEPPATVYGIMAPPQQQMGGKVMRPVVGELSSLGGRQVFYTTTSGGGNLAPRDSSP